MVNDTATGETCEASIGVQSEPYPVIDRRRPLPLPLPIPVPLSVSLPKSTGDGGGYELFPALHVGLLARLPLTNNGGCQPLLPAVHLQRWC